jgi:acyl carrier protein
MNRTEIKEKLKELIAPYVEDKTLLLETDENTDLMTDLSIDSANLIDVILDTEEAFNIEIDDEAAENMFTVKDTIDIIMARMAA